MFVVIEQVTKPGAIGVVLCEQVEGGRRLLKARPEQCGAEEEHADQGDALLLVRVETTKHEHIDEEQEAECNHARGKELGERGDADRDRAGVEQHGEHGDHDCTERYVAPALAAFRIGHALRSKAGVAEVVFGQAVLQYADQHGGARAKESGSPVPRFADGARDERGKQRTEVDAHVEDRKACIASRTRLTLVERADDGRDVGLEQTHADHDDRKTEIEHTGTRGHGEQEIPERDDEAAPVDCAALADQTVGDPAARQRKQEHGAGVETVDGTGGFAVHAESRIGVSGGRHQE